MPRSGEGPRALFVVAAVLVGTFRPSTAHAADFEVSGTTATQLYEVASPWGYELERRRLLQTLGFSVYHLQGAYKPNKPDYNIRVMFRVDADFGLGAHLHGDNTGAETDFEALGGTRFVPGLTPAQFDLMAAYVEGKNVANGWLTFRAGRQYVMDSLGWWSFDGGLLRVHTPAYFDVEVYGGFEQRGGLPLSTSRYEAQGVWRGSHSGFDEAGGPLSSDYPSYNFASYAPAVGVAIESSGPNWVHGRLTYRRVYNTGEAFTTQYPALDGGGYATVDGLRISSDRLGWAGNVNKTDLGGLKGGFAYDFYNQVFSSAFGGIEAYATDKVTIGLDADHYVPTFDADSIWNWFTRNPTTTATGRVEARFTKEIDLSAQGGVRVWGTEGDPDTFGEYECQVAIENHLVNDCDDPTYFNTTGKGTTDDAAVAAARRDPDNREMTYTIDGLGQLAARYRRPLAKLELRGMVQAGGRGYRGGGDLSGEKLFDGGKYAIGARTSVYTFSDEEWSRRPDDPSTVSFAYVLGAGWKPLDLGKINVEFEHDINERIGHRFRVLGRLDVLWAK